MTYRLDPPGLLAAARRMVDGAAGPAAGAWSRAGAILARKALERGMAALWESRAPSVRNAAFRNQLICLPAYLRDHDLARRASYAWHALSRASHHHAYEVGLGADELIALIADVESILGRIERARGGHGERPISVASVPDASTIAGVSTRSHG